IRDVGRQFHVDWEFSTPSCQNQPIDLGHRILGSESYLGFRYLGEDTTEIPSFSIDESVVHQISTLNSSQWEGARDQDDGNMFAICTGDAVYRAKSSDPMCHNHCA